MEVARSDLHLFCVCVCVRARALACVSANDPQDRWILLEE